MVGRKPKPTRLKIVTGNPGKRPLNRQEPSSGVVRPRPPKFLSNDARKAWSSLSRWLADAGVLERLDVPALEVLCTAYGRWRMAEKAVNEITQRAGDAVGGGLVVKTQKGNYIQSPMVGIANRAAEILMKSLVEFGMTPSARSRIHAEHKNTTQDKAASYFQKAT